MYSSFFNGRESFGLVESVEMKNQQEELHKLQEVLSLAKKDLKKENETKAGSLCMHVCHLTTCVSKYVRYVCTLYFLEH